MLQHHRQVYQTNSGLEGGELGLYIHMYLYDYICLHVYVWTACTYFIFGEGGLGKVGKKIIFCVLVWKTNALCIPFSVIS